MALLQLLENDKFEIPGLKDFQFNGGFIPGVSWLNKPVMQAFIAMLLVIIFWLWLSKGLKVVPTKRQFFAEYLYDFVRKGMAADIIGHDFRKYVPYLLGLFSFVAVNNLFGEFFLFMFPTFSNVGFVYGLVVLTFLIYVGAGFQKYGFKYIRRVLVPPGVPWWLYWLIMPLEFVSNFITRPLTLALRLFANMFGGHLVMLVLVVGGSYLLTYRGFILYNFGGAASIILAIAMMFLETFIGLIQAYIFTVLTAQYIASSLAEEH